MLQLNNLSYRWPSSNIDNISDLSFNLHAGEWVALVGDNGAGKSTLLRLLAGLLSPTFGSVLLNGQVIAQLPASQRANQVGILFQEAEKQIFHSTVKSEVAFGLKRQKLAKEVIAERVHCALEICHLADVADKHPLDLHAGQRRMVAVACLEAVSPPLLLLDEPSRDFDALWTKRFENWLNLQRGKGTSIIAISHDFDFVARQFERVLHLSSGRLIGDGTPVDILSHPVLQQTSELPAPTLISLSKTLALPTSSFTPDAWANTFIPDKWPKK